MVAVGVVRQGRSIRPCEALQLGESNSNQITVIPAVGLKGVRLSYLGSLAHFWSTDYLLTVTVAHKLWLLVIDP